MMKKIVVSILCVFGFTAIVSAQVFTNTRLLKQAAVEYKISGDANFAKAMTMAKERGWSLSYRNKNGNLAVLVGMDDFGYPKYYVTNSNTIAAATTRANQLWPGGGSGLNLTGGSANMKNKLGVWDGGGVFSSHVELAGRITQKDNPSATIDHATHTTGTLIASGVNPAAKGMAYGTQGVFAYDFTGDIAEINNEAPNLVVSNHSYGLLAGWSFNDSQNRWEFNGLPNSTEDYKFGYYSNDSQSLDDIAYNAPFYLIVKSAGNARDENGPAVGQPYFRPNSSGQMVSAGNRPAGISNNDGYDIVPVDAGAKNILTVGAVAGLSGGYARKEDVVISAFSSWGPTDDGRIKPDIVADGINVLSPIATPNGYASFSGTSMSAPNAAGSLFLLQEYYSKLKAGAFLRSATLKGLAIHTAEEAGSSAGPDYQFGWGLLNVEKAAAIITAAVPSNNAATSQHQLYENVLAQGATFTINVIATGKGPLKATLCWTDVKGTVDATRPLNSRVKNLVNDLDIRITKGSGASLRTYMPWTLDVNNPSFAAVPGDNTIDNVEKIDMDSTVPGQVYTIKVAHKGTLSSGSQAYSLLVSGTGGVAYCTSSSGGGGARIDSVGFSTVRQVNPTGSKQYTDYTNQVADIEPSQTLPISVKVSTADATTNSRIVKVFIDYNNNGVFDIPSELAATSGVLTSAAQVFTANVATPANLTVGNTYLMRVIVQETVTASDVAPCGTYGKGETQDYRVRVINPSNDMTISQYLSPNNGECWSDVQYVTVKIRNNGTAAQTNIPVSLAVATGGTSVLNISATYPGTIKPLSAVNYTFQTPYVTAGATTYAITATVNSTGDQLSSNNALVTSITTAAKPTISAVGEICGTNALLKVNSPSSGVNYFWYSSATTNAPFAAGSSVSTNTIPADKTYHVAREAKTTVGPANKLVFASGGYNNFVGNFLKFNNTVPLVLETVRFYIGNPGTVKVTVGTIITTNADGSFTYQIISSTTLDVYATNPNPQPSPIDANGSPTGIPGNPANDLGAIYYLNLPVVPTGDHILLVECDNGGATIFRNNAITGTTTYPMALPNIISINGNGATGQEQAFYYFFYDLRINTGACVSDRAAVVATTAATPVISQVADSLTSNIASGNQWFLNDTAITTSVSNLNHFKPSKSGSYKVVVTDAFGCQRTSNSISVVVTAIDPTVTAREINLMVSPNPNNGVFNLSFEVTSKADLTIQLLSSSGQRVYNSSYANFVGKFSRQIRVAPVSSEFYILKIQHNKKTYVQKLVIQR